MHVNHMKDFLFLIFVAGYRDFYQKCNSFISGRYLNYLYYMVY